MEVLSEFLNDKVKDTVQTIKKVLKNFGVDESLYNQVISSGDVVYEYFLKRNHHGNSL